MSCCDAPPPVWAGQFDHKRAGRDLVDLQQHGPAGTTQALIDLLLGAGVADRTILDIGGGVGAISLALLDAGAREARSVEVSAAYQEAARGETARHGFRDRIQFQLGDFVALAPQLPAADIVTLDRVVCCYAQMEPLVRLSAEHCLRLYGLVYPRDHWLERTVVGVQNAFRRLWRNPFRSFIHPVDAIDAVIRSVGFTSRRRVRTFAWEVVVYERL